VVKIIEYLFLFSWKKFWMVVVVWFISIVLHNLISGLMGGEEAFLFIIAVFLIPLYVLIAIVYNLVYLIKKRKG